MTEPIKQQPPKSSAAIVQVASAFSGPIPPPNILKQYDDIVPGAADRILKMAEQQSAHRQRLEVKAVDSMDFNAKLGTISGLIVALIFAIVATYCIYKGANLIGLAMVIGDITGLLFAYLYGKRSVDHDLASKRAANRLNQE